SFLSARAASTPTPTRPPTAATGTSAFTRATTAARPGTGPPSFRMRRVMVVTAAIGARPTPAGPSSSGVTGTGPRVAFSFSGTPAFASALNWQNPTPFTLNQ